VTVTVVLKIGMMVLSIVWSKVNSWLDVNVKNKMKTMKTRRRRRASLREMNERVREPETRKSQLCLGQRRRI
jgi:hypothetical protein